MPLRPLTQRRAQYAPSRAHEFRLIRRMGLANAAFFVLPSTERSLLFYAYEILGAFARFSGKIGLPESELQLALVDAAEPEAPQVDRRLFSGYLSELTLKVEENISKAEDKLPAHGACANLQTI